MSIKQVATFKAGGAFEATPLVWNGRVYIGCRDGSLYCLGDTYRRGPGRVRTA